MITVVSGLPRSGTSMMMNMLYAGGMDIVTDGFRKPDADNPNGYFECERVKKLRHGDVDWLQDIQGKAIKVVSGLLCLLPKQYQYQIIFMRRKVVEIVASHRSSVPSVLTDICVSHLKAVMAWLEKQENMRTLYADYNQIIINPEQESEKINQFLGGELDTSAMFRVVDVNLYRCKE